VMNQVFIGISLPKTPDQKRFTGINFIEHKHTLVKAYSI
jgi:hypothetical protein